MVSWGGLHNRSPPHGRESSTPVGGVTGGGIPPFFLYTNPTPTKRCKPKRYLEKYIHQGRKDKVKDIQLINSTTSTVGDVGVDTTKKRGLSPPKLFHLDNHSIFNGGGCIPPVGLRIMWPLQADRTILGNVPPKRSRLKNSTRVTLCGNRFFNCFLTLVVSASVHNWLLKMGVCLTSLFVSCHAYIIQYIKYNANRKQKKE